MLLVPPPLFRSGTPALTFTFIGSARVTGLGGSSTTQSFDIGVPSANRHILVVVSAYYQNFTGCTILGVAATPIFVNSGTGAKHAFYLATVPSGSVGNIVITVNASLTSGWAVDVYRIDKATLPTLVDSETLQSNTQNLSNSGIVVPADGGIVVATRSGYTGAATRTFTWTGLTENSDGTMSTNYHASVASEKFGSGQNPLAIGVNCSGTITGGNCGFSAVCLQ